jgi:large subunit ribosomal protein L30
MPHVKITQERSKIRCIESHKRTLAALGLRRIRHSVVHEDTPQIRGMIDKVRYLVRVEAVSGAKAEPGEAVAGPPAPKRAPVRKAAPARKAATAKKTATARKAAPKAKKGGTS